MHGIMKVCTSCKRRLTPAAWRKLAFVGLQRTPADRFGPEEKLELRNCGCGTTLAIDLLAEPEPE